MFVMSTTNIVKDKLDGVFNLLAVAVNLKKPNFTVDDYGTEVVSGYTSSQIFVLPHVEQVEVKELMSMGDTSVDGVLFAVQEDVSVDYGDLVEYLSKDYKVVEIQEYSWGGVVMKSLKTTIVG